MTRYFLDVVGHERSELDYTGHILPTPDRVYDLAELIAFDLAVKKGDDSTGWAALSLWPPLKQASSLPDRQPRPRPLPGEVGEDRPRLVETAAGEQHALDLCSSLVQSSTL
jgi:hypothetical protein